MAEQKIEFRKIREFGENISDTLLFIRQNLKPLLGSIFAICGIFLLAQAVFNGLYQSHAFSFLNVIFKGGVLQDRNPFDMFNGYYFLMLAFTWLASVSVQVVVGVYIKFYVDNGGLRPSIEEVWQLFRKYFFRLFFYSIPLVILIIIGMFLCIIPGVWLAVVWAPFSMVVIMEDRSFGDAVNRCFELVKENFWISLVTYLVAGLIYYFSASIVGVFVGIIAGLITYFSTSNISTTIGIVTSFLNIFSFLFSTIYFVSVAMHYFNLAERRDGTGILNRIDTIGSNDKDTYTNAEEEY